MRPARLPVAMALQALLACGLAAALLATAASAYAESEAPSLRADVVRAGHEPAPLPPHVQWTGFLELAESSNVTAAWYQVCRVGDACFAPPTPAMREGSRFSFNTSGYLANGRPVDYEPGWRLGVTWLLEETTPDGGNRTVRFPEGPDLASEECFGDAALGCSELHYLVFEVAGDGQGRGASAPPAVGMAVALALAAAIRRLR